MLFQMDRRSDNWEAKKLKGTVEKKVDLDRCGERGEEADGFENTALDGRCVMEFQTG